MNPEVINTSPITISIVNCTGVADDLFKEVVDKALSDVNSTVIGKPINYMLLYLQVLMIIGIRGMAKYKVCSEEELITLARVSYRGVTDVGRG